MRADYDVDVEWRAFELHPEIPPEGAELPAYLRSRMGPMTAHLQQMAAEAGLPIAGIRERMVSSRRALEATEYAREQGKHDVFHRIVFRKLFADDEDISRWPALRAAAEEAGLDPDEMQQRTEAALYTAAVDGQVAQARRLGITGVPAFIFDNKYLLMGAQPYEVFHQVMAQLAED